jgi:hypothetical protein
MREKSYRLAVRRGAENRPLPNDVFDSVLMSVIEIYRQLRRCHSFVLFLFCVIQSSLLLPQKTLRTRLRLEFVRRVPIIGVVVLSRETPKGVIFGAVELVDGYPVSAAKKYIFVTIRSLRHSRDVPAEVIV